jgi:hypothetical protein
MTRKVVIAGDKYDGPDIARLKLHEEYGRVWLYLANEDGTSKQNGRLLCVDDDGRLRIAVPHTFKHTVGERAHVILEWPE